MMDIGFNRVGPPKRPRGPDIRPGPGAAANVCSNAPSGLVTERDTQSTAPATGPRRRVAYADPSGDFQGLLVSGPD